ncbi:FTR1 family protein [Candidatus Gottesmanbacteria bacterium]|nr:FTR1 family protein [Candidatus Gottesmanbacteria bacterium]
MLPSFLITFREVIEASLIVATILGILVKLKRKESIKTVWLATLTAIVISVFLLSIGSLAGFKIQEIYSGPTEELTEGILMVTSAIFITWAVFFLHNYFGKYKTLLLTKIKSTVQDNQEKGLFGLVFLAVFREGFEIVLFLTTIYFSDNPANIFSGFILGAILALMVSAGLFMGTLKLPVFYAFRVTSLLLILFAGGLLARGVHEFAEFGAIPEISSRTLSLIPNSSTFLGSMIKAVFGITQKMDFVQISLYASYVLLMTWWVFLRRQQSAKN